MTRISRCLILLPIAAAFSACSSSSTGPGGTTTNNYVGTIASPAATGSFTATMITSASADIVAASPAGFAGAAGGPRRTEANVTTATITITLLNGQTLTLTGTLNGAAFSVSDNASPPDMCTGSLAPQLNATCTIFGVPGITLTGLLTAAGFTGTLSSYCGVETAVGGPTTPDAYLYLGVAMPYAVLARVASADNSVTFYADQNATATAFSADLIGSTTDFFSGNYSISLASGTHTAGGSVVGNWTSANPCTLFPPSLSGGGSANFTAVVGAAPANQVIIFSPATVGPLTAVVVPATATWLTATVSANSVILSAASQTSATPVGSPLTATVDVWPQFASGPLPVQIPVTYTVLSAPPPTLAMDSISMTFTMTQGGAAPAAHTSNVTVTGGSVTGLSAMPTPTPNWLNLNIAPTSISTGTPAVFTATPVVPVPALAAGQYMTTVTIASTTPGAGALHIAITLNVNSATVCTITTPSGPYTLNVGTFADIPLTYTGACPTAGNYYWTTNPVLPLGLQIIPDIDAVSGTPQEPTAGADYTLIMIGTSSPNDTVAKSTLNISVGPPSANCAIGPVSPLPPGTSGGNYDVSLQPSSACVKAGDNPSLYTWTLVNPPPGLTFSGGLLTATGSSVDMFGTLPTVASGTQYMFTIEFKANNGANGNTADSGALPYVLTIR